MTASSGRWRWGWNSCMYATWPVYTSPAQLSSPTCIAYYMHSQPHHTHSSPRTAPHGHGSSPRAQLTTRVQLAVCVPMQSLAQWVSVGRACWPVLSCYLVRLPLTHGLPVAWPLLSESCVPPGPWQARVGGSQCSPSKPMLNQADFKTDRVSLLPWPTWVLSSAHGAGGCGHSARGGPHGCCRGRTPV